MFWTLVRRNIAATKGQLLLMLLSIILGVSFVSGSFLLADSLRSVFGDISEQIYSGTDVRVRGVESELATGEDEPLMAQAVFDQLVGLEEVGYAEADLFSFESTYTLNAEGEVNRPKGPPVFSTSWDGPSPVSVFKLLDGRPPGSGEIAIDEFQANRSGLSVGDSVEVVAPAFEEPMKFEVVGIIAFGESGSAFFNVYDLDTLQQILGVGDQITGIAISRAETATTPELIAAIEEATGFDPGIEAVQSQTLVEEQESEFGQIIDIIGYVLLGFAVVVLFVSVFIIYNTFAILIGQRIRQFGLLRSIGMLGGQITKMVVIEALALGVLASILGLFGGIGTAEGLKALFSAVGSEVPDGPIVFKARTIIIVFVLGVGVTLVSALIPAWLAGRIPALAAFRDGSTTSHGSTRRRTVFGGIIFAIGVTLVLTGLFGSLSTTPRLTVLGVGSASLFVGVALLSTLFASAATNAIGAPVELVSGLTGRLGRDNASRNPQRTAATASALMIGLALISGVLVLAESIRTSFNSLLDEAVAADIFVFESNQGLPFASEAVVDKLKDTPVIADVAAIGTIKLEIAGEALNASVLDTASQDRVFDLSLAEGTYLAGNDGILVHSEEAETRGIAIKDEFLVEFIDGQSELLTVTGIFGDNTLLDTNWVLDRELAEIHADNTQVGFMGATFVDGVDPLEGQRQVERALANFPQLAVQNNSQFKQTQEGQIDQFLYLVFGLLGLCIVVAFFGILNTMVLSVLERTREIGLLRAVGTSRRQIRSMVRWEAMIVGVFWALLGVVLGIAIGYVAVSAIPDSFITDITIPWKWAVVFTMLGAALGILAAVFPARRAAKLDVLEAITHL